MEPAPPPPPPPRPGGGWGPGAGPRRVFVTLGYASWGEGQLESEITENSWLTVQADPKLIFETPVAERYDRAMALLGLQSL